DPVNITSVGLLDRAGINRADSSAHRVGIDESPEAHFSVLAQGRAWLFGPVEETPGTGSELVFAAPVRIGNGAPPGVLRLRLESARIGQTLQANLQRQPLLGAVVLDAQ